MVNIGDHVMIQRPDGSDKKGAIVESIRVKLDKPEFRGYHDITHMTVGGPEGFYVMATAEGGKRKTRRSKKSVKKTRRGRKH